MSNVPLMLITLPLDVTLEITDKLDWNSLLSIRQSCRYFNELTRTLSIWNNQYRQYVANKICPSRLEEPLDSHSAADLEKWVLRRRSADMAWKGQSDVEYTRIRKTTGSLVGATFIIPGGRWLLVGDQEGGMLAYDLNASPMTKTVLIPRDGDEQPINMITIDIHSDTGSRNLTFTMAISPYFQPSGIKIHVWRVALVGHGIEALLDSSHGHVCSFEADTNSDINNINIRANFFARSIRVMSLGATHLSCTQIFDWTKSTSSVHCKADIITEGQINEFRLLPDHRLLVCTHQELMLYTFITVQEMVDSTSTNIPHVTQPLWETSVDIGAGIWSGMSDGISDEFATYFILSTNQQIFNLVIPHTGDTPRLSILMDFDRPRIRTMSIGLEKAFVQHSQGALTYLSYPWNHDADLEIVPISPPTCISSDDGPVTYWLQLPKLDEETGRIIRTLENTIFIFDTAQLL